MLCISSWQDVGSTQDPSPGSSAGRRRGHYFFLVNKRLLTQQAQGRGLRPQGEDRVVGRLGRWLSPHQDTVVPFRFAKALLTNLLEDEGAGKALSPGHSAIALEWGSVRVVFPYFLS